MNKLKNYLCIFLYKHISKDYINKGALLIKHSYLGQVSSIFIDINILNDREPVSITIFNHAQGIACRVNLTLTEDKIIDILSTIESKLIEYEADYAIEILRYMNDEIDNPAPISYENELNITNDKYDVFKDNIIKACTKNCDMATNIIGDLKLVKPSRIFEIFSIIDKSDIWHIANITAIFIFINKYKDNDEVFFKLHRKIHGVNPILHIDIESLMRGHILIDLYVNTTKHEFHQTITDKNIDNLLHIIKYLQETKGAIEYTQNINMQELTTNSTRGYSEFIDTIRTVTLEDIAIPGINYEKGRCLSNE